MGEPRTNESGVFQYPTYTGGDALSVDALADELLAAIRDHPEISLDPAKGPETQRLCAAYNRLYCELHDKEPPPIRVLRDA